MKMNPPVRDLLSVRRKRLSYDAAALVAAFLPLVKEHSRLATDAEDNLLKTYIATAINSIENLTGIAIAKQSYEWTLPSSQSGQVVVFPAPIVEATVSGNPGDIIDTGSARNPYAIIEVENIETPFPVVFSGGAETIAEIEPAIVQAIIVTVAHLYENREFAAPGAFGRVPYMAELLLEPYRNIVLGV